MKNGAFWVAVLENMPQDCDRLIGFIEMYAQQNGIKTETTVFCDGPDLLNSYDDNFDVLLLEIELPTLDGMTVAEQVREKDPLVPIIFTTNLAQYAIKGYDVDALGFLVKPVDYAPFANFFARAIAKCRRNENVVVLGGPNSFRKVHVNDIIYIAKDKNYIVYQLIGRESFRVRGAMKNVFLRFENTPIKQCSSGCMVNLRYVTGLERNNVHLGEIVFPISMPFRKPFAQDLMDYIKESAGL